MMPTMEKLLEELENTITWAVAQGQGSYILNDNGYPFKFGYTLFKGDANQVVMLGGIVPAMAAITDAQLKAALKGEAMPTENPKFNIDWDLRNEVTGNICTHEGDLIMGTFDFNTPEEGAKLWAKQLDDRVPKWVWVTTQEAEMRRTETQNTFEEFHAKHCAEDGDCPLKDGCAVRWPGGFGLKGCKVNYIVHPSEPAEAIQQEIKVFWGVT